MRRTFAAAALYTAALLAAAVHASEAPTPAYQKAMKDMGAANTALRAHVKEIESAGAYPDYTTVQKDAAALKTAFAATLAFWNAKNVPDAVKISESGVKGVEALEKAIADKSYDALASAATTIGSTCGSCHKAFREQLPDGTYVIK